MASVLGIKRNAHKESLKERKEMFYLFSGFTIRMSYNHYQNVLNMSPKKHLKYWISSSFNGNQSFTKQCGQRNSNNSDNILEIW